MIAFNVDGGNNGDEIEAAGLEVESAERSAGLDKIEGGEENRPLVQNGQGVEVQGSNERKSSLESRSCHMVSCPSIELEVSNNSCAQRVRRFFCLFISRSEASHSDRPPSTRYRQVTFTLSISSCRIAQSV